MSAQLTPEVIQRAAHQTLSLAERGLIGDDLSFSVGDDKLPVELKEVREQIDKLQGTPEGKSLEALFDSAVIQASTAEIQRLKGPDSGSQDASAGGAVTGASRIATLQGGKRREFKKLDGVKYKIETSDGPKGSEQTQYFRKGAERGPQAGEWIPLGYNPFSAEAAIADDVGRWNLTVEKIETAYVGKSKTQEVRTVHVVDEDGAKSVKYFRPSERIGFRELHYNPFRHEPSFGQKLLKIVMGKADVRKRWKKYKTRVDNIIKELEGETEYKGVSSPEGGAGMLWSLQRIPDLKLQEGILRKQTTDWVNPWDDGTLATKSLSSDFGESTIDSSSLTYLFKMAMDIELPAIAYSYAASQPLHDYYHNVGHFMGTTLTERVISAALNGKPGVDARSAIWMREEERHGHILDAVYNAIKQPDDPTLHAEGSFPIVRDKTAMGAKQMMLRREFAEIAAATGYMVMKANATPGTNAERALDGIFRDEVFHYVVMVAGMTAGKKRYPGRRFINLLQMLHNAATAPEHADLRAGDKNLPDPLLFAQAAYAFIRIERMAAKFMKRFSDQELKDGVGKVYTTEKAMDAAEKSGEHFRTRAFSLETCPDLSEGYIKNLEQRFGNRMEQRKLFGIPLGPKRDTGEKNFSMDNRSIRESEVEAILEQYKTNRLTSAEYWMSRKQYKRTDVEQSGAKAEARPEYNSVETPSGAVLQRELDDGSTLTLSFPTQGSLPHVTLSNGHLDTYKADMAEMTMREIGCVMYANGAAQFAESLNEADKDRLEDSDPRAWIEKVVANLGHRKYYKEAPLPIIRDVTAQAAGEGS